MCWRVHVLQDEKIQWHTTMARWSAVISYSDLWVKKASRLFQDFWKAISLSDTWPHHFLTHFLTFYCQCWALNFIGSAYVSLLDTSSVSYGNYIPLHFSSSSWLWYTAFIANNNELRCVCWSILQSIGLRWKEETKLPQTKGLKEEKAQGRPVSTSPSWISKQQCE